MQFLIWYGVHKAIVVRQPPAHQCTDGEEICCFACASWELEQKKREIVYVVVLFSHLFVVSIVNQYIVISLATTTIYASIYPSIRCSLACIQDMLLSAHRYTHSFIHKYIYIYARIMIRLVCLTMAAYIEFKFQSQSEYGFCNIVCAVLCCAAMCSALACIVWWRFVMQTWATTDKPLVSILFLLTKTKPSRIACEIVENTPSCTASAETLLMAATRCASLSNAHIQIHSRKEPHCTNGWCWTFISIFNIQCW